MATLPDFQVIQQGSNGRPRRRQPRRDWQPLLDALRAGNLVFVNEDEISDANIKYLAVAIHRTGSLRLRSQRDWREDIPGRLLWAEEE